ncbi:polysaccharide biosynthesis protein [Rufibacter quisquiliarum]|uniref:FlaA1/EpsC-like NDP-sugar epimerase n=1 Tax=Rufibacter quisquiliarum TaxID=1549639 RepID=A0A839GI85_9BACT|nr:nucleoside-diphosphate sugar epimerase/dehydratase [Rufibacter quisquiliarum]MBA9076429.1 FlaA1/EpsC-like NDP-sugar epimerase [Rufibacter quisquiliarum]
MMGHIEQLFHKKMPKQLVFFLDICLCALSFLAAYLLRFNFDLSKYTELSVFQMLPIVLGIRMGAFFFFRTYAGILRYTSLDDLRKIFFSLSASSGLLVAAQLVYNKGFGFQNFIPISVLLIDYVLSMVALSLLRVWAKLVHYDWQHTNSLKVNVAIFGAGEIGNITLHTLQHDMGTYYQIVSFLDDDPDKAGLATHGVPIQPPRTDLPSQLRELNLDLLILAVQRLTTARRRALVEACLQAGVQVLVVPPVYKWINGELSFKQIREVRIEDVVGRPVAEIDSPLLHKELQNRTILVTGAAGSIGSELVRQLIQFKPKQLILLDQAESALYDLELELTELYVKLNFEVVLGDICNTARLEAVFRTYRPELVFHCAAYKHVPVMEENPTESLNTNILGTKILADLAIKYQAQKFVLLSTDKAVNPTSVMGASKRLCEMYVQAMDHYLKDSGKRQTRFITTRFGNVLGSTGSVIPRFRKQIQEGGPITVTHPDISRYFMTIQEACQLVLEASAMGQGGEIYIFDMGDSIKIVDLAKKMIKLSGLALGKDIQLVYTGLRPGEKLEEELFLEQESVQPTAHPKIRLANMPSPQSTQVLQAIQELIDLFVTQNNVAVIKKMKQLVPEYVSQNSVYQKFDVPR